MVRSSAPSATVSFEEFEADLRSRELRQHGSKVRLPDQSFKILAMLLEHPGELITREEFQKKLWPEDTFIDFDHGLNNAINRLREALGDSAGTPHFIETLPRRGYRFIAPVVGATLGKTAAVSEAQPSGGKTEKIAIDAVSANPPEIPKGGSHHWLLLAALAITVLAPLIVFQLQKTLALPSTRSFVLPPEGATFKLIGDSGGSVALTPDGTKLAFVAVNSQGRALIWVRPLAKLSANPVSGTEGATSPFWSPDGSSIGFFADAKLKKVSVDGGTAVTLSDAPFGRGGSWSPQGVIVFAPSSHTPIYQIPASGGVATPVTVLDSSIHTTHRWPKFLPDGRHFIYLAANHFSDASHNGVYLGSLDGQENKLLVQTSADATYTSGFLFFLQRDVLMAQPFDPGRGQLEGKPRPTVERVLYDPSIWKAVFDASGNGVMAYQLGDSVTGTRLRWFDRSGRSIGTVGDPGFQWEPRLSRDGRKLAAGVANGGYSDLWVYDLTRGAGTQITFTKFDDGTAIWSSDGSRIFFSSKRQHYSLYQVDSSGARPEQLVLDTGADTWPEDLSPDDRFLLYGQGLNIGRTQSQLWVYPTSGGDPPFRLLNGHALETGGQFSPNGHWIAYASNQSGRDEVYVTPFPAPASSSDGRNGAVGGRIQVSLSGGRQPRWRRDGRELFYLAPDNRLMAVPVLRQGPKFEVGAVQPLFHADLVSANDYAFSYDISAEGTRFIINTAAAETTAPLTLVENWPSDFNK